MVAEDFKTFLFRLWQLDPEAALDVNDPSTIHANEMMMGKRVGVKSHLCWIHRQLFDEPSLF